MSERLRGLRGALTVAAIACVAASVVMILTNRSDLPFQIAFVVLFAALAVVVRRQRHNNR